MKHAPRNILVTGGAGFIGCNFVRHLLATDSQVRVITLDLLTYAGKRENLPDGSRHHFVQGDICDRDLVDRLLREYAIDSVVNFAAETHVDRSITGPEVFVRTNVHGTLVLLEAARAHWQTGLRAGDAACRFLHISTDEVYGTLGPDDAAFTETTAYAPNSPYSASKAGADHLVRAWFHTYGLPVLSTHCSNNFGPYQHDEKLIPTVIRQCRRQQPIPIYGDGGNVRDWLFVGDHCTGIDAVLRGGRPGERYNIGGGNECCNRDLVRLICQAMDRLRPDGAPHERLVEYVSDRPGHDWRYAINAQKIRRELGWQRAERFTEEIEQTVRWYLQHGTDPVVR